MKAKRRPVFRPVWKDYVSFNARELTGLKILIILMLAECGVLYYLHFSGPRLIEYEVSEELEQANLQLDSINIHLVQRYTGSNKSIKERKPVQLFPFDPNTINNNSWNKLGLSEKQIVVIKNYLNKGGRFRVKKDFQKMYCIPESQFDQLAPWILLPDTLISGNRFEPKTTKNNHIVLDVNEADSAAFESLRGIGPVMASRIVRYRERLGGFVILEQLKEVYGFSDSLFDSLLPQLELTKTTVRKIGLNSAAQDTLGKHPYIGYKMARLIINYRQQHQGFKSTEELVLLPLITDEIFRKLAPYLTLD